MPRIARGWLIVLRGDSQYEPFDVYFPLLFPLSPGRLNLRVLRPGSKRSQTLFVATLTYRERIAPVAAREAARRGGSDVLFEWRDLDRGAAYLRMPNWALYDSHWDWRGWLGHRLDALAARGARALIIDLRGNEGGEDVGDEILARLIDHELPLDALQRLVRYRSPA